MPFQIRHDFTILKFTHFKFTKVLIFEFIQYLFFRTLYKCCVDDRKSDYLTLERYVARRVSVDFNKAFPLEAEQWTLSNLLIEIREAGTRLSLTRVHEEVDNTWNR